MRVLYLDIDTLRPDHLACYGYSRKTSPNIDRLAAQAIRFDNCYASDAPCLPSRSACWTGRFGIHTGVVNHGGLAADPVPEGKSRGFFESAPRLSLVSALKRQAGLYTASISPFAERHAAWWFYAGFREMHNPGRYGYERADEVVPMALDWLDRNAGRNDWFLHVNLWDPHALFRTPMDRGEPFAGTEAPAWPGEEVIGHHRSIYGPHGARETSGYAPQPRPRLPRDLPEIRNREDFVRWIDGYDTGIWYADLWIGRVLEKLETQGVLDETMIIVTSDHGENHGELGIYGDHHTADRITCRVPYILRVPELTGTGRVDRALHYQADLSATVLELLGVKVPETWDGQGFAEALKAGREQGREYLVVSNQAWACQRGVVWNRWLAMRTYHTGFKAFPAEMLFDIERDPQEAVNLARSRPEIMAEGLRKLDHWTAAMLESSSISTDPLWTVMNEGGSFHANEHGPEFKEYLKRLRETDRGFYADWLEEHRGRPIPDGAPWAAALEPGQALLSRPYRAKP